MSQRAGSGAPFAAALTHAHHRMDETDPGETCAGASVLGGDEADAAFGNKIRQLRKEQRLSLKDLSERSGLSVALISQVERGLNAPSMRSLRQLASGLGVSVRSLFSGGTEPSDSPAAGAIVRYQDRRVLNLGASDTFIELLTPPDFEGLQTFHSYIAPNGGSSVEYDSHVGTESGVVVAGRFDLWLDGERLSLGPGDSFSFSSQVPHRYHNPGKTMTQVIWAISPPIY
ncbi:helix-turn-helix domain-containing protein [Acuticoccus kandeliae]|uniref:helix-turn-helix domain-containing protein n=1 Tax=Acuticoccus kandeliae TaxID=2073160 RepID=UPI00147588B9|nr:cupin domain-containing protein [Acuticoccus kandeliae]